MRFLGVLVGVLLVGGLTGLYIRMTLNDVLEGRAGVKQLLAALAAIGAGVFAAGVHLPSPAGRIDPKTVRQTPPFDRPRVRGVAPGEYEVVLIARAWAFEPNEIRVPRGSIVRFRVASADVIHGFLIENTNVNVMVIPGQIAEVTARFERPGEYVFLCHEYCGFGHHQMFGKVIVE